MEFWRKVTQDNPPAIWSLEVEDVSPVEGGGGRQDELLLVPVASGEEGDGAPSVHAHQVCIVPGLKLVMVLVLVIEVMVYLTLCDGIDGVYDGDG